MDGKYYVTQDDRNQTWAGVVEIDKASHVLAGYGSKKEAQDWVAGMVAKLTMHHINPRAVPVIHATKQKADKTMYKIVQQDDGTWIGHVRVQDSTEYTDRCKDKDGAISAVVRSARTLNGVYIMRDEVVVVPYNPPVKCKDGKTGIVPQSTVDKILSGDLVLVPKDSKILKYRITDEECEQVLAWREGRDACPE